jgi:NAD(P)-dependent dehydrogenase (short-subunit alcohol dehydrogenase family)
VVAKIEATELLRPELLAGVAVVVARAAPASPERRPALTATVEDACTALGARVLACELAASGSAEADDAATGEGVAEALAQLGEVSMLLVDAASAFTAERDGLVRALEASWRITLALANAAFIERGAGGRIVYVAPRADAGAHADAARAGLENLARTLSIEWARYGIAPVTIAPGAATGTEEIAALTGYLASPAGAYFSGCLLDLRGAGAAPAPAE